MSARPRTRSTVSSQSAEPTDKNPNLLESCPCENTCKKETNLLWICCDKCQQWWHTYCLGITNTEYGKLKNSHYICPKCSIQKIRINEKILLKISGAFQEKQEKAVEIKLPQDFPRSVSPNDSESDQNAPGKVAQAPDTTSLVSKQNIVILDNVRLTKELKNSAKLKKEIKKHKPDINISQIYPLAGGGVALHCKDNPSKELALSDWPKGALNSVEQPNPHSIKSLQGFQTIVVKSVNTKFTEPELLQDLKKNYPSVQAVHRLYRKQTGSPFPIVKVKLSRAEASEVLASQIVVFGQSLTCETCRSVKVVRCYGCQRFGHTADSCLFSPRCVNCSGCHNTHCTLPSRCANCDGEHGADSNKCPAYLSIRVKLETRKMASC